MIQPSCASVKYIEATPPTCLPCTMGSRATRAFCQVAPPFRVEATVMDDCVSSLPERTAHPVFASKKKALLTGRWPSPGVMSFQLCPLSDVQNSRWPVNAQPEPGETNFISCTEMLASLPVCAQSAPAKRSEISSAVAHRFLRFTGTSLIDILPVLIVLQPAHCITLISS